MSDDADKVESLDEPAVLTDAPTRKRSTLLRLRRRRTDQTETIDCDAPVRIHTRPLVILSGLISPFAIMLEISGLVTDWYVKFGSGNSSADVVETQPNPTLLETAIAISLALAVIANAALIMRFLERRCYEMTIIACVALTLHDAINIAAVTAFGVIHAVADGFDYGQPWYMTIASTGCSLVCNITLIVDFIRVKNFRAHGSGLTESQRQLVIAVMALLIYISLGSIAQKYLLDLSFEDALYFVIVSVTTVGFGDIAPKTTGAQAFTLVFNTGGILMTAFSIGIARATIIESFEQSYRRRRQLMADRARERRAQKRANHLLRLERQRELAEKGLPLESGDDGIRVGGRGGAGAIARASGAPAGSSKSGLSAGKIVFRRYVVEPTDHLLVHLKLRQAPHIRHDRRRSIMLQRTLTEQSIAADNSYAKFKSQMRAEESREFAVKLTVSLVLFLIFWLVGAAIFRVTEGWSYWTAIYFCYIFFATIGYGDYSPTSSPGRAFFIVWSLLGVGIMTVLLSVVTERYSSKYKSHVHKTRKGADSWGVDRFIARNADAKSDIEGASRGALSPVVAAMSASLTAEDNLAVPPDNLGDVLLHNVRGFHEHANFFLHGREGDVPERLRGLLELQHDDVAFAKLMREVELNEGDTRGDVKHVLFMVSFQRSIEALVDVVERTSSVLTARETELESLRSLSAEMRSALADADAIDSPEYIDNPESPLSPADQRRFRLLAEAEEFSALRSGTATPTEQIRLPVSRTLTFEERTPPARSRLGSRPTSRPFVPGLRIP